MRHALFLIQTFGVVLGHETGIFGQVSAKPGGSTTRLVRVRSESPEIADMIARASETSATFRRLMAVIDGTDGLIYRTGCRQTGRRPQRHLLVWRRALRGAVRPPAVHVRIATRSAVACAVRPSGAARGRDPSPLRRIVEKDFVKRSGGASHLQEVAMAYFVPSGTRMASCGSREPSTSGMVISRGRKCSRPLTAC